ncbi:hypothetical protein ABB37_02770 [Leptomonas pyrrhocoris]|uniref:Dynactin subunit 5 n=1 Tax=Leptomonas pyrrhocoris TaxID=157538 RepID=A0A0M9G668_LEPPY|nr:hypothetical protein ABB37_02770 [Leptomonas pyrrhocoris]KPA83049.1 hypothetical protein ABB37_02770 [Leptomonas pyrrhocoris]|eukprot:XP_015661488.1 hypothetical protein ABB37_02770 [Leptomonas pyrrhocoris]
MTHVPPLMTSGSSCPLPPMCLASLSRSHALVKADESSSVPTNSYEDVSTAAKSGSGGSNNTLIAHSAVVHTELAVFDIGAFSIIRGGAVLRPPIRMYATQSTAGAMPTVKIGAFVYVGPQVVCEAAEVGQLVRMEEQCVVAAGARVPDGVWLQPKTYVPPEAVLAPYTVYRGVPACPVEKLNASVYQLQHLEFLRQLRILVSEGKRHDN